MTLTELPRPTGSGTTTVKEWHYVWNGAEIQTGGELVLHNPTPISGKNRWYKKCGLLRKTSDLIGGFVQPWEAAVLPLNYTRMLQPVDFQRFCLVNT